MRILICLAAVVAMTACSSKKKNTEEVSTSAPTMEQKTMNTGSSSDVSTDMPEQKPGKKGAVATTTTEPSASSEFGALEGTEKSAVTCSNKSDSRKISILNVTSGGCGVVYNKAGEDKTVAVAKADMSYCDKVSDKIKGNLEGAGFNCGGGAAAPATGQSSDQAQ